MRFEIWQVLLHTTSFAVILAVLFTKLMPLDTRLGLAAVLLGLMISFGAVTLPRPKLRAHVPTDRDVRRWSDVVMFGLPGSILVWIGVSTFWARSMWMLSVPYGLAVGVVFFAGYCGWAFARD